MNWREARQKGHKAGYALHLSANALNNGYMTDYRHEVIRSTHVEDDAEFFARAIDATEMARRVRHLTGYRYDVVTLGSVVPAAPPKVRRVRECFCPKCKTILAVDESVWAQDGDYCPDCEAKLFSCGAGIPGDPTAKLCDCGGLCEPCKPAPDLRSTADFVRLSDGRTLGVTVDELALSNAIEDAAEDDLAEAADGFHLPSDAPMYVFDGRDAS